MKKYLITLIVSLILILSSACCLFAEETVADESKIERLFIEDLEPQSISQISSDDAQIIIASNQWHSRIYLNNIYHGNTKLKIANLMQGEYVLQLQKNEKSSKKYYIAVKKGYALLYYVEF